MTLLDQLAARLGIEERFRDANGEIRETSVDTRRRLLASMGIHADDEQGAGAALATLEDDEWRRSLPPVRVVIASSRPAAIEVVAPAGVRCIRWSLQLESGEVLSGALDGGTAMPVAARRVDGRDLERRRIELPSELPLGYHLLTTDPDSSVCSLVVTPGRCWLPDAADRGERLWGVAAQLYLLRSEANWGIGDFTDLRKLAELVERLGGDVVGINPLHSMFLDNPEHASPYSPENRLLLNVLNIDVEAVPELSDSPETRQLIDGEDFQARLRECRAGRLVDYAGVAALKLQALKLLFDCCRTAPDPRRWREFESFRQRGGEVFERSCLFEALRQHFASITGALADWHSWPADYRDPSSSSVTRFAEEHSGAVTFYAWLQWLADQQLEGAAAAAGNMRVGIYRDLAVGADSSGAANWSDPQAVVAGAHAGAPPDVFNPAGQNWGLLPFDPRALTASAYRGFIDLVRANMRHAGGLRIDHAMALRRLYWIPEGAPPNQGAYVRYPMEDLIGILALESHRHRCLVVGEDLGTAPEGFRESMIEANILSYRVLFFEQDLETGEFLAPSAYPRLALAVAGSHDLPTLRGWWRGADIDIKEKLNLFPDPAAVSDARRQRDFDRGALIRALRSQGLLHDGGEPRIEELTAAVHGYLGRAQSLIVMAQMDDITAETDPVNVPATSDEHPNWRRRHSLTLEQLEAHPRLQRLAAIFARERRSCEPPAESGR